MYNYFLKKVCKKVPRTQKIFLIKLNLLKTTNQLTTYQRTNWPPTNEPTDHLPPTNRPRTNCTGHQITDHQPKRNMRTRNSITNFKWIADKNKWDRVINVIWRTWVIISWLKPEYVIEKIKLLKVKLMMEMN